MRKWYLGIIFSLYSALVAMPIQDRRIDPIALSELTTFLSIDPDANLIEEAQKKWLRKPTQERWEMEELSLAQKQFVLDWSEKQGIFSSWKPSSTSYDKALILGATTSRMQMRLEYLKSLWKEGVRFQEVVWLTGDRPLDPRVDELLDRATNESEASRILWAEADLPEEMKNLPVVFVAVPMKEGGKRPTTHDTLVAWVDLLKAPCSALFVSDQPFCGYQFSVVKGALPEMVAFDLVGEGADSKSHPAAAAITLDSIARWLYQDSLNASRR